MNPNIERNERTYNVRNLDTEPMTGPESALTDQVLGRQASIDARTEQLIRDGTSWALPQAHRGQRLGSKLEQDIDRDAMFTVAHAALADPVLRARNGRRRVAARTSEVRARYDEELNTILDGMGER